jgi:hypothetical protein
VPKAAVQKAAVQKAAVQKVAVAKAAVQKKVLRPRDILASHVVMRGMHGDHTAREQAGNE